MRHRLLKNVFRVSFLIGSIFQSHIAMATAITRLEIQGNGSTRAEAIADLLPRPVPTDLTDDEIAEFSRRIKNLGIFDSVATDRTGTLLKVSLRRKNTVTPILGLSTGKKPEDSSFTAGLQDYDFGGDATRAGGKVSYAERGLNFSAWLDEHTYSPNRWAREYEVYRLSSGFRFEDGLNKWSRNRIGGFIEWVSPFKYGSFLIYEFQLVSYYEDYSNIVGNHSLSDVIYYGGLFEIIYDRYKWDDLAPSGYKLTLELRPGATTSGKFRGEARFKFNAAIAIHGRSSFVFNGNFAAVNSGDVNHSLIIGSQQGVRGLPDSFYRAATVGFINTEYRHSFLISNRTYLQPVVFIDGANFRPMGVNGHVLESVAALSGGTGLRIVPTAWTNFIFRFDIARLVTPHQSWTGFFGITQYF